MRAAGKLIEASAGFGGETADRSPQAALAAARQPPASIIAALAAKFNCQGLATIGAGAAPPLHPHASLARLPEPFDHADWIYELKLDGFRALAYVEDGRAPGSRRGTKTSSSPSPS